MTIRIKCRTVFDITATGVRSHYKESRIPFHDDAGRIIEDRRSWMHSRNQQRNWETLNQLISLRTLPEDISTPIHNKHTQTWEFEFDVVNIESVTLNNDPVGALILQTQGSDANIWFELI